MAKKRQTRTPKKRRTQFEIAQDLSERLGRETPFHESNVSGWRRMGAPVDDPAKLEKWYRDRFAARAAGGEPDPLQGRYLDAKTQRLELRLARESGQLADMDSVNRTMVAWINDARTLLEAAPEAAGMLIADPEQRAGLVARWQEMINDVLRKLATRGSQEITRPTGRIAPVGTGSNRNAIERGKR